MNLSLSPAEISVDDVYSYTRWQEIFKSWFWRYYDHFFLLIFCNIGWFLVCFAVNWLAGFWGILSGNQHWNWLAIYSVCVLECVVSVPWALAVFTIFIEGSISLSKLWTNLRLFFWKASISSILFGLVIGLTLFNLRFYSRLQISSHVWIFILMGFAATIFLYVLMMAFYQWPILFFQNPSLGNLFCKSFLITLGTGPVSLLLLFFSILIFFLFILIPFFWILFGFVFLFSLYVVALEKHFLKYKITYQDKPVTDFLVSMDMERQRGWRDILKPWEPR